MTLARPLTALVAIGLVLAACGGDSDDTTADTSTSTGSTATTDTSSTSSESTTTTDATTTSESTTTTTGSVPDDVVYAVADPAMVPPPLGDGPANGSGCNPGPGDLPDGVWFGIVRELADTSVEFDLACWFGGEAANEAAAEDGETEIPVPNDYYIRNESDVLRTVPVVADAPTWIIPTDPGLGSESRAWTEWVADPIGYVPCPGQYCLAWLYVNDGQATEVVTQYTP